MPNTAMTASPTNFSTVPPCRSRIDAEILEVPPHARAQGLRIRRLAERRRPDEIAEEDRHDLALLARRLRQGEGGSAGAAEARVLRVLPPTAGAPRHVLSLRGPRGANLVQHGAGTRGRDDVALLLVEPDRALDGALRVLEAADAYENLTENVVDEPLQLQEVDRLGERDGLVEQRERLVVSAERREGACSRRSPSGLCVEIVDRRDGPTGVGELERFVGPALEDEGVREHGVHRRAHADVADLDEHVVCASQLELRAIEIPPDELADSDVSSVEAHLEREVELLEQAPRRGRGGARRLDVTEHRLEEGEDLEGLCPERRVRLFGREEPLAQHDALGSRHRAPARRS